MFFCGRQNFTSYSFLFSESYIPTSELYKHLWVEDLNTKLWRMIYEYSIKFRIFDIRS